jgi:hypothetical protein
VFCHLSDFLIRKGIGNLSDNPIDEINYGQWVRAFVVNGCSREISAMAKTPTFGIRLDPVLKAALERLAKQDKRPLSSLIHKILEEHVEAQRKVKK